MTDYIRKVGEHLRKTEEFRGFEYQFLQDCRVANWVATEDLKHRAFIFMSYYAEWYCFDNSMNLDLWTDEEIETFRRVGEFLSLPYLSGLISWFALAITEQIAKRWEEKDAATIYGYVYVLRSESGHYKIGRSKNPKNRLKTFGVKLPFQVEYELIIPAYDDKLLEKELHTRFASKHINGEWFALTSEDVESLREEYLP